MGKKKILITLDNEAYSIYNSVPKGWRGALVSFAIKHLKRNRNAWKSFTNIAGLSEMETTAIAKPKQKKEDSAHSLSAKVEVEKGWG